MAVVIELPHVGESVVEGVIGKWLAQPGDQLRRFDPLVEVVTDKVTMEVPSPYEGVLTSLLVSEGDTVPMGAPIAEIETNEAIEANGPVARAPHPAAAPSVPPSAQSTAVPPSTIGYLSKDLTPVGPTGVVMAEPEASPTDTHPEPAGEPDVPGERRRYSPAVKRLAREHNIDPDALTGSGMGGRVTRDDVMKAADSRSSTLGARSVAQTAPSPQSAPAIAVSAGADEEAVPLSAVRRMIAEHMSRSASEIPHAWSMIEVDVTPLAGYRDRIKDEFRQREGVALTYIPFAIKCVVEALKENPLLNSSWGGDKIILKKRMNIGIAVAATGGLVVPVIHNADGHSIAGLARAAHELTDRARQGRLTLEDVQGGTFTLNNTGALGSIVSQPIINHPQAGILTIEAVQKRPVVVNDAIAIRSMMNVCLSFDHRIADGSESASFLQSVKQRLEAMGPDTPIY
jgi:2-oxoisovalerate dehydrogenase E2 component (dihydrolipoyl transacylase)